jgi:hypothetical protein
MMPADENSQEHVRIPFGLTDIPSHALFLRSPPPELFHYTSLDGARGIIESKSLRLTKVAYLNDRSELAFAIRLFRSVVDRLSPSVEAHIEKPSWLRQLISLARSNRQTSA